MEQIPANVEQKNKPRQTTYFERIPGGFIIILFSGRSSLREFQDLSELNYTTLIFLRKRNLYCECHGCMLFFPLFFFLRTLLSHLDASGPLHSAAS